MLTTLRADNSPHVVAVGFTFDPKTHIARVITSGGSQKAVNADRAGVAVLSQVDGARWLSLEGRSKVNNDADAVRDAACVQHPNVASVYEFGVAGPAQPFVATELVEGRSLASVLELCPLRLAALALGGPQLGDPRPARQRPATDRQDCQLWRDQRRPGRFSFPDQPRN